MKNILRQVVWWLAPVVLAALSGTASAQLAIELGGKQFADWSGVASVSIGVATIGQSGEAGYRFPDGTRGQYKHGFRVLNDSAAEWQDFYGVQFEVKLPDAREVGLTATIQRALRGPNPERRSTARCA
jgi:hypothetical protein